MIITLGYFDNTNIPGFPIIEFEISEFLTNPQVLRPIKYRGIIDTGADRTKLSGRIITDLNLSPDNPKLTLGDVNSESITIRNFFYNILLTNTELGVNKFQIEVIGTTENSFGSGGGIDFLIGRDFLQYCYMIYDGGNNLIDITFNNKGDQS